MLSQCHPEQFDTGLTDSLCVCICMCVCVSLTAGTLCAFSLKHSSSLLLPFCICIMALLSWKTYACQLHCKHQSNSRSRIFTHTHTDTHRHTHIRSMTDSIHGRYKSKKAIFLADLSPSFLCVVTGSVKSSHFWILNKLLFAFFGTHTVGWIQERSA